MSNPADKPLDGMGLAVVNQIINERLAGKATMEQVNAAIQAAILDSWERSY